jgi:hypothetical protein
MRVACRNLAYANANANADAKADAKADAIEPGWGSSSTGHSGVLASTRSWSPGPPVQVIQPTRRNPAAFSLRTSSGHLSQPVTVHQAQVGQGTRKSDRLAGRYAA